MKGVQRTKAEGAWCLMAKKLMDHAGRVATRKQEASQKGRKARTRNKSILDICFLYLEATSLHVC